MVITPYERLIVFYRHVLMTRFLIKSYQAEKIRSYGLHNEDPFFRKSSRTGIACFETFFFYLRQKSPYLQLRKIHFSTPSPLQDAQGEYGSPHKW